MTAPTVPVLFQPDAQVGQTRIIEKKGIYVLNADELTAWKLRILVDVIREPTVEYKSLKPNEPEHYYGVFQLVEKGYVIQQANIKYLHQQVYRYQNDAAKAVFESAVDGQTIIYDLWFCTNAILNAIPNGGSIDTTPPQVGRHLPTPITEIWFNCANTAKLAVHSEYLPLPTINAQPASIPEPKSSDSPSAPDNPGGNPSQPPGTSPTSDPTAPYHPSDQDNGRTTPTGTPLPGGGFWYFTSQFYETRNDCQPQTGTAVVDGADDPNVRPFFVQTGVNAGCAESVDGHIVSNGGQRQILGSSGQFSFEYR